VASNTAAATAGCDFISGMWTPQRASQYYRPRIGRRPREAFALGCDARTWSCVAENGLDQTAQITQDSHQIELHIRAESPLLNVAPRI